MRVYISRAAATTKVRRASDPGARKGLEATREEIVRRHIRAGAPADAGIGRAMQNYFVAGLETITLTPAFDTARPMMRLAHWAAVNVHAHKQPGWHCHDFVETHGGIPGDASSDQMDLIADLADQFLGDPHQPSAAPCLPHEARRTAGAARHLEGAGLATANEGRSRHHRLPGLTARSQIVPFRP